MTQNTFKKSILIQVKQLTREKVVENKINTLSKLLEKYWDHGTHPKCLKDTEAAIQHYMHNLFNLWTLKYDFKKDIPEKTIASYYIPLRLLLKLYFLEQEITPENLRQEINNYIKREYSKILNS